MMGNVFSRRAIGAIGAAVLVVGSFAPGCGTDSSPGASLDSKCSVNSDCDTPLVCAFAECHVACASDRDCTAPALCVQSDKPDHVCQLAAQLSCTSNDQCPGEERCAVDGRCRDGCQTERDCTSGDVCAQGTCAGTNEVDGGLLVDASVDASQGAPCNHDVDCLDGLVCKSSVCVVECITRDDCAGALCEKNRCVVIDAGSAGGGGGAGGGGSAGGSLDAGTDAPQSCVYNTDCSAPLVCRANGTCGFECNADRDCGESRTCVLHTCVAVANLPDGAPPGYGSSCELSTDCPPVTGGTLLCKSGLCIFECNGDLDCAGQTGACCNKHSCVTGPICAVDAGAGDDGGLDGGPDAKPNCTSNDECDDKIYCDGIEVCEDGFCMPGESPCDSHAMCIKDSCDETTHACTHETLAPSDADDDGHYALACGGDDCDDTDATTYQGAPELCDHKDNDCNGIIDDHSRHPLGGELDSTILPNDQGAVAPLGSGWIAFAGGSYDGGEMSCLTSQILSPLSTMPAVLVATVGDNCHYPSTVFSAAGELNSAAVLFLTDNGGGFPTESLVITKADGSFSSETTIIPSSQPVRHAGDVIWTGTCYLVASATTAPSVELHLVGPDGAVGAGVALPGVNISDNPGNLFVARSNGAFAVAWNGADTSMMMATYSASLGELAAPFTLSMGTAIGGMAGTQNGFVVLTTGGSGQAQWFADDGTPGKSVNTGLSSAAFVGDFDGEGASFATYFGGSGYFLRATDMLQQPIEVTPLGLDGPLTASVVLTGRRAGKGANIGLFFAQPGAIARGVVTGCTP